MAHPKFGNRYTCFECATKFYDMNKPKPECPKCGANQKKAPKKKGIRSVKPVEPETLEEPEESAENSAESDTFLLDPTDEDDFKPANEHKILETGENEHDE